MDLVTYEVLLLTIINSFVFLNCGYRSGSSCYGKDNCYRGMICSSSKCSCKPNHYVSFFSDACIKRKEKCRETSDCPGRKSYCDQSTGLCKCFTGLYYANRMCTSEDYYSHKDSFFGGYCENENNCDGNLICNKATWKCDCQDNMEYNTESRCKWKSHDVDSDSGSSSVAIIVPVIVVIMIVVVVVVIIKLRSNNHARFHQGLQNAYAQHSAPFSNQAGVTPNQTMPQFNSTSYPVAPPFQNLMSNEQMPQVNTNSASAPSYDPTAPPPSYNEVVSKV